MHRDCCSELKIYQHLGLCPSHSDIFGLEWESGTSVYKVPRWVPMCSWDLEPVHCTILTQEVISCLTFQLSALATFQIGRVWLGRGLANGEEWPQVDSLGWTSLPAYHGLCSSSFPLLGTVSIHSSPSSVTVVTHRLSE